MPIRSTKGRSAALRRLWGWPLRSVRHLVATVVAAAVVVWLAGQVATQATGPQQAAPVAAPSPTRAPAPAPPKPASSIPPPPVVTDTLEPMPAPAVDAPRKALKTATKWAEAFVSNTDQPNEVWLAELEPLTLDQLEPAMRTIEPSNVPASEVTGEPVPTQVGDGFVRVLVPTDNARLELDLTLTEDGWRVGDYRRAEG